MIWHGLIDPPPVSFFMWLEHAVFLYARGYVCWHCLLLCVAHLRGNSLSEPIGCNKSHHSNLPCGTYVCLSVYPSDCVRACLYSLVACILLALVHTRTAVTRGYLWRINDDARLPIRLLLVDRSICVFVYACMRCGGVMASSNSDVPLYRCDFPVRVLFSNLSLPYLLSG